MNIQDQVCNQIQARINRICQTTYLAARRKRKKVYPLGYPVEVDQLLALQQELLGDPSKAESIAATITSGSIQDRFLKS